MIKALLKTLLHGYIIYYSLTSIIWIFIIFNDFFVHNLGNSEDSFFTTLLLSIFVSIATLIWNIFPGIFIEMYKESSILFSLLLIGLIVIYKGYTSKSFNFKTVGSFIVILPIVIFSAKGMGVFYKAQKEQKHTYNNDNKVVPIKDASITKRYQKQKDIVINSKIKKVKKELNISYPKKLLYQENNNT